MAGEEIDFLDDKMYNFANEKTTKTELKMGKFIYNMVFDPAKHADLIAKPPVVMDNGAIYIG